MANNTRFSVVDTVVNTGFKPSLFAVAQGTYASNAVYGSGAEPLLPTYDEVTILESTSSLNVTCAKIRRNDKNMDFDIQITLDTTEEDPWGGLEVAGELRIRTLPSTTGSYNVKIGIPALGLPRIDNVEILDENGLNILPQANNILKGRFLYGGEIALIRQDITAAPEASVQPLLTSDLSQFFGELTSVRIIVRGSYLTNANPTGH